MTDKTPSRRAGLRDDIAAALEAADYSGTMRRGDLADSVMPVLYREWPWLRAEADEAGLTDPEVRAQLHAVIKALGASETENKTLRAKVAASCSPAMAEAEPNNTAPPAPRDACPHCPDPLCPVDCPECGSPIHDLDAVPAQPTEWTAPPPGGTREQLPDHLLALIRDRLPDYTSTACQTADTLACAACYPGSGVPRPQYDEIREHAERLHSRCRLNNKFTGQLCACGCHPEEQQ